MHRRRSRHVTYAAKCATGDLVSPATRNLANYIEHRRAVAAASPPVRRPIYLLRRSGQSSMQALRLQPVNSSCIVGFAAATPAVEDATPVKQANKPASRTDSFRSKSFATSSPNRATPTAPCGSKVSTWLALRNTTAKKRRVEWSGVACCQASKQASNGKMGSGNGKMGKSLAPGPHRSHLCQPLRRRVHQRQQPVEVFSLKLVA